MPQPAMPMLPEMNLLRPFGNFFEHGEDTNADGLPGVKAKIHDKRTYLVVLLFFR